jgi:hypothetical protein
MVAGNRVATDQYSCTWQLNSMVFRDVGVVGEVLVRNDDVIDVLGLHSYYVVF